ncbi:TonB-dependent receptor [Aequorivita capsosiphonis]|uniref:TonB-dependent receptor n=1 Tax=Aequorivita capsosiphonis TaxID=487317 RepID=UPI0004193A55|nr:TonB-dependent receptor [Aequorivita capsosiphonis]
MSIKQIVLFSIPALLLAQFSAFSQEKELDPEVVNIVKPYTPTISDAFKVKETPSLNDSVSTTKKDVKYSIFSVPVASTFTPAKGKAATVEKTKPIKLYDNYATLGFGNYTSILGELYSNFEISRTDNAGFFFRHNSSQGDIKDVRLDNQYYDTSLDANYTSRQKNATYRLDAGVEHQIFNWYGLPNDNILAIPVADVFNIDPLQMYFSGYVGGSITLDESFFDRATANVRYLGDAFSSSEFNVKFKPEFSFPLENLTLKIDGDIDYLSGSFKRDYANISDVKYSYLNAGLMPSITFVNEDLTLSLGVAGYVSVDSENSNTHFSLYPKVNVSYRLLDETVILYGGADGGLQQNSFYNFKEENPYVSPTLAIAPTKKLYNGFGGVKGKLSNAIGYNARISYGKDENKALFQKNTIKTYNTSFKGYDYGNSFNVVYDDVNTLAFFGEVKVEISDKFTLGVNANYYSYSTDPPAGRAGFQNEAWNLPEIKASLFSNFNITEKLYGGASIFYVGERKDLITSDLSFGNVDPQTVTLDGYVDANLSLGYRFTDRLSVFVKGSNLFGDNYEKWMDYPVQGIQGLAGVTYKFDW